MAHSKEKVDSPDEGGDASVGLANPHLDHAMRKTLDLVNKLHSTGVQVDIDLPQIAVIGSQSAGKSSLIESISGITLPRAAGTCTRCPTECRLSHSKNPWQCVVFLRFTTDAEGQPVGQAQNEVFGPTIFEKSKVEERIRRAQQAILNPKKPREIFLQEDNTGFTPDLSFSINCVSLQISGPDVADLSFCDLPGLIVSVGSGGNTDDIALVESLVASYIKKPSCIILLAVTCETDFENQGAYRLAKQYDPDGKRTIGVLTKPDRIPTGEESRWISFITNTKEPLENGWFCVKQPGSNEIQKGITWRKARAREDEFFSVTPPWSELDSIHQRFLRTWNLVDRLSTVLSDLISKRLPEIQEELERAISNTDSQLKEMPREHSSDPLAEIMGLLHQFVTDVLKHVEGIPASDGLIQQVRGEQMEFNNAIEATTPEFKPFCKGSREEQDDSDEEAEGAAKVADKEVDNRFVYYLDEVMEKALHARTRELPGYYPYIVQEELIKGLVVHWRAPALVFSQSVHRLTLDYMKTLVQKHFSSFGQGLLEQRVKKLMQAQIKKCWESSQERIEWLLEIEERPATLNTYDLAEYRAKFLALYKGLRSKELNPELQEAIASHSRHISNRAETDVDRVLHSLIEIGIRGVKPEDLPLLLPPDPMEPALDIMANVRAYFQVAFKRFVDNVPNATDVALIRGITKDLLQTLYVGLGIHGKDGQDICRELAKDYPAITQKREELKKKLERLNSAMEELLLMGYSK